MNLSRSRLAAFLLLALAGPAPGRAPIPDPPPARPANLLVDGSFEAEGPPAWFARSWRGAFRDYATQQWDVREGRHAAEVRVDGPADDAMLAQLVAVKPRTRYRLTGWAMTAKVAVEPGGLTGANLSLPGRADRSASVTGDSDWSLLGFEFETDQEDQVEVAARLGHHSSTATGTAWFDDLSLTELGPSTRPARRLAIPPAPAPPRPGPWPGLDPRGGDQPAPGGPGPDGLRRVVRRAEAAARARFPEAPAPVAASTVAPHVLARMILAMAATVAVILGLSGLGSHLLIGVVPAAGAWVGRRRPAGPILWGQAAGLVQAVPISALLISEAFTRGGTGSGREVEAALISGCSMLASSLLAGSGAGLLVAALVRGRGPSSTVPVPVPPAEPTEDGDEEADARD